MGAEDLIDKIEKAVQFSGYPLEQRVGNLLLQRGWHTFHSVVYSVPGTEKQRELDLMAFKMIQGRRIELRIACKRSVSKPWVMFTEDDTRYMPIPGILKVTPVVDDTKRQFAIMRSLSALPLFSHDRRVINFTVFSGKEFSNESRTMIRDALYSVLTSVYDRLYPYQLLFDPRGQVTLFITIFDGLMFESFYDHESKKDVVRGIEYAKWQTPFSFESTTETIPDAAGNMISLADVIYYFKDWFVVEILRWSYLSQYLDVLETTFENIPPKDMDLFGAPWVEENFPSFVSGPPKFSPATKRSKRASKPKDFSVPK
jgi:hypothetical protein